MHIVSRCTLIFSLFIIILKGQINPEINQSVDIWAKNITKAEAKSIDALTQIINQNSKSDYEKVRAIYVWIGSNVSYDIKSFKTRQIPDQSPQTIFKYKMAVCQGYSELFKKLCSNMNIPCEIISGYSKGFGYKEGKKFKSTDHAWNTVKIDGKWFLVDATWGAGYVDENEKYVNKFTNEHFLTTPTTFVQKHLPADPMWQLLINEISLKTFEKDSITIQKAIAGFDNSKNYSDTLARWEMLDSTSKIVNSSLRIIRFNPENNDAWYKMGWFYYMEAWKRLEKLNDPILQRDRNKALPLAKEAVANLQNALIYMNEIGKRDPFYGEDIKQKKELIHNNIKSLNNIIGSK
jgi:hypothetical protein